MMMRGTSFSVGELHLMRFPSTRPSISARSSKVQFTPADSSGTLWASNTSWGEENRKRGLTKVEITFTAVRKRERAVRQRERERERERHEAKRERDHKYKKWANVLSWR